MTRPPHPGEVLAQVMREKNITLDDMISAGLPAQWLSDLLRRLEEIPLRKGRSKLVRLAAATQTPVMMWVQVQEAWHHYRVHQHVGAVIHRRGLRS